MKASGHMEMGSAASGAAARLRGFRLGSSRSALLALALLFACAGLFHAQAPAPSAAASPSPKIECEGAEGPETMACGEEDVIRKREEWFFSSRRAGAVEPMDVLRWKGVAFTREQLRRQAESCASSPEGQGVWTSRGPASSNFGGWSFGKVSGRTIALAKDWVNDILYAGGASGGLWKSTNDGASWTYLFESAGTTTVGAIAVDPNDPQTLWVGTGENSNWCEEYFGIGLLRSRDGGATWELRNGTGGSTLGDLSAFASIIVDPRDSSHLVVGGGYRDCVNGNYAYGGIYTSNDAGATWVNRLANAGVTEVVQDPVNRDIFWAAVSNLGLFKSTDSGATWILQISSSLPRGNVGRSEVAISPINPDYVYVLFGSASNTPQFWRTTNGGATWTKMSSGGNACDGQCSYNMVLRADRGSLDTVYRGTIHIFKSTNGGTNWTDLSGPWGGSQTVHQDTHEFLMHPTDPKVFYVGCDGGVWKTEDAGHSFKNLNANLNMTQFYAIGNHPTDDGIILGGAQDNSSLARVSSDTWELQQVTGDGFVCHINPKNPNTVYIAGYPYNYGGGTLPSVFRSTTGPQGYFDYITGTSNGISAGDRINWVTPYLMDPSNPDVLFLGTHRVYRSLDGGSNWTQVGPSSMASGSNTLVSLDVNRADGSFVYAGTTSGKVWQSKDGGANWADISAGLPARSINDIAGDPGETSRALCVVGGFNTPHLYSWPGSGSWTAVGSGLPNVPANAVLMLSAADVYVGTDVGIFRSGDGGQNFEPFMGGMPQGTVVTDLKYAPATKTITAGTYGRGAWQYTACARPGVPAIGTVTAPADNQLRVSWTPGSPAGATYSVFRSTGACPGGEYTLIASGLASSPLTDTGLVGGVTYSYQVTAEESTGECGSASSACASGTATGPDCTVPGAPLLSGAAGTCGGVDLNWSPGSGATASYNIYRMEGPCGGAFAKLPGMPVTGSAYRDTSAVAGRSYAYSIRGACDAGGLWESGASNCLSATALSPPPAPTDIHVASGCSGVSISWTSAPGAAAHSVLRGETCGVALATFENVTSPFEDASAVPGVTYRYWVVAANGCGPSPVGACSVGGWLVIPSAPDPVTACGTSSGIRVVWPFDPGVAAYDVMRGDACGTATATFPSVTGPFEDSSADVGPAYQYWVIARNACGVSGTSLCASAVRPACWDPDVNCDAAVNILDMIRIQRCILGIDTGALCTRCDVNHDNVVNILDMIKDQRIILGVDACF